MWLTVPEESIVPFGPVHGDPCTCYSLNAVVVGIILCIVGSLVGCEVVTLHLKWSTDI